MRLDIRQTPSLRLRPLLLPRIRLEVELLQLPILELSQRIQQELEKNPCLEEDRSVQEASPEETKQRELEEVRRLLELGGDSVPIPYGEPEEEEETVPVYESKPLGFWQRIEVQLHSYFAPESQERKIAEALVEALDGLGFLAEPVETIAERLGVSPEDVERVRQEILREWDPEGIAALDQRELLLIQLESLGYRDTLAWKIIHNHWDVLSKEGWEGVQKVLNVPRSEIESAQHLVSLLYSSPSEKYAVDTTSAYIVPEVYFRLIEGRIVVELEESGVPRLRLSRRYMALLNSESTDEKTKKFIIQQVKRAEEFLAALDKRRQNIRKVAELIAEWHEDFLKGKTIDLKPLTQTEAAQRLEIPVSTLNRVVKGRYAETPVGLFELRFFFQRGAGGSSEISLDKTLHLIQEIIENEDPERPYTDDEIRQILKRKYGVILSRRSVAIKRASLGIPNSNKRRKRSS